MKRILFFLTVFAVGAVPAVMARAADGEYTMEVKDGNFVPSNIDVPSGEKIKLTVKNTDSVEAEFESTNLNREQKIQPGSSIDIYLGPLNSGSYDFFNDNNPDATGKITAK